MVCQFDLVLFWGIIFVQAKNTFGFCLWSFRGFTMHYLPLSMEKWMDGITDEQMEHILMIDNTSIDKFM